MGNKYIGNELELFEHATNWKNYYGAMIKPLLKGCVLEVGAGIGGTTKFLCDGTQKEWLCVEPDEDLISIIDTKITDSVLPPVCKTFCGTLAQMDNSKKYDAVLYIDVIEHISDDNIELKRAAGFIKSGGNLIILVPAHNKLYSAFDKKIGHYRRYNRSMLKKIVPPSFKISRLSYLDAIGCLASYTNKIFLKQSMPTVSQVKFWDRFIIPVSKVADKILGYSVGKSVIMIAEKNS